MDGETKRDIKWEQFAILDRGVRIWTSADNDASERFLQGVNPDFFMYLAGAHQRALHEAGDDEKARMDAALGIRLSFGMALESLMAFLCATLQAPHCVYGWLSLYSNGELREMVRRIREGRSIRVDELFRSDPITWEHMASTIFRPMRNDHPDAYAAAVERHSRAWKMLADSFLSEDARNEYNAIKHGFRTRPETIDITIEPEGVQPIVLKNPFANHFPVVVQKVDGNGKRRKCHYDLKNTVVSLEPDRCVAAMAIVAQSLHNVRNWLRAVLRQTTDLTFRQFEPAKDLFAELDKRQGDVAALTYGVTTEVDESEYASQDEILAMYDDTDEAREG
jgi:hypothetical protein